jgi:hypothetical protein
MNPPHGIEALYRERIDRMTIAERVQRAAELFAWSRGFVARQVVAENGALSGERLKWEVALRQYGADPKVRSMIERMLARASR